MKTKKKVKFLVVILLAIVFLPGVLLTLLYTSTMATIFVAFVISGISEPVPDVPETRYAEFPFELVYEQNGNIIEISDVYVCKYDGIYTGTYGKHRSWEGYIKGTKEQVLTVFTDGKKEVYIGLGGARYYMGDPEYSLESGDKNRPTAFLEIREPSGLIHNEMLSDEELYSEYGIKIISWKLPDPIENTFVPKKWYEFWK